MIKFFVVLLLTLSSAFAANLEAEVIDTQVGLNDYTERATLCLTVVREVNTGKLYGIVEDITDCFYTRQARRAPEALLTVPTKMLQRMNDSEMLHHLQAFDSQLEFLWSTAD